MKIEVGEPLFSIVATPAELAFLDRSINSCEVQGDKARLTFRGGLDGPWFDWRRGNLKAKDVVKGVFG